jgi:hypothetical protein
MIDLMTDGNDAETRDSGIFKAVLAISFYVLALWQLLRTIFHGGTR